MLSIPMKGKTLCLKKIKDNPKLSISKLANECGLSIKVTRVIIEKLKSNGTLYRVAQTLVDIGKYLMKRVEN